MFPLSRRYVPGLYILAVYVPMFPLSRRYVPGLYMHSSIHACVPKQKS